MTRSSKPPSSLIVMGPVYFSGPVWQSFTVTNPFHRAMNQASEFAGVGAGFRVVIAAEI
jgi:hypothetical protein